MQTRSKRTRTFILATLVAFTGTWLHTPILLAPTEQILTQENDKFTVMWDLGGTLVDVSKMSFVQEIGAFDATCYFVFDAHFEKNKLQNRIFEVLTILEGEQEGPVEFQCKHNGTCSLPKTMAHWLAGMHDNPETWIQKLEAGIDQLLRDGFFINKREYRLIRNAVRAMFSPEILTRYQKIIKPMLKLLEKVHAAGHTCMILSNWDAISYDLFMQTVVGQKICQFVSPENMVISGRIGLNKPHPSFFDYVLHTYNLNARNCFLIDNDLGNCVSATTCGINAFCYTGDAALLEQQLTKSNIL